MASTNDKAASHNYISIDSSNLATSSIAEVNTQLEYYLSLFRKRLLSSSSVQEPAAYMLATFAMPLRFPSLPVKVQDYLVDNTMKPKLLRTYSIEKKEWLLRLVKAVLRKLERTEEEDEMKVERGLEDEHEESDDENEEEEENIAAMFTDSSDDQAEDRQVQRISDTVLYRMSNDCKSWHEKKERDKQRE